MTATPDLLVSFASDGLPDTDWLGSHERFQRARGETLVADALAWMIASFDRFVKPMSDPADAEGLDSDFPRTRARIGQYRLFEFTVALEERRLTRAAILEEGRVLRSGDGDVYHRWRHTPTYSEVAREEIRACMGNFLCTTAYASELGTARGLERWIDTVPSAAPEELRAFTGAYLDTLSTLGGLPASREEAMRAYARAVAESVTCPAEEIDAAAGKVHAMNVILTEMRTAPVREDALAGG